MTTDRSSENQANWTSDRWIQWREEICCRFEDALRAWQTGGSERPRSEDFLADVPGDHRWQLLQCLLLLEEDYRREAGEEGALAGEFRARFPEFGDRIDKAFSAQESPTTTQAALNTVRSACRRVREYELREKLGQGGMGIVWKAWHVRLKKYRAIKVLHAHLLETAEVRDRFLNEMEALARFEHANIVRAHDAFEEDGQLYLVMEYVRGSDVSRLVGEGRKLPAGAACEIIYQAARGLAVLHDQHVTHRDIKPANLMLTRQADSGRLVVKVMDLGLSQMDTGRGLTNSGEVFGTCEFMAPEQYEDCHDLTPAADVYSLGCSLFFLLTGRPPYSAEGAGGLKALKLMLAHQTAPIPRLREVCPESAALQPLLDRMMAKKADKRFASAAALLDELEPFADQEQLKAAVGEGEGRISADPTTRKRPMPKRRAAPPSARRRRIGLIAALAVIGVGIAALSRVDRGSSERRLNELQQHAAYVASEYGKEIDRRLSMLRVAARDPALPKLVLATSGAEPGSAEFSDLRIWLEDAKLKSDLSEEEDTTWFITDATGRQVAREPHGASLGRSEFWTRSYFHGLPADLDAEVDQRTGPVREETVSAPYLSTSEQGQWKIAFSTPVFGSVAESLGDPIGILSMSVRLADLTWFQTTVDQSAITLVEFYRESWLEKGLTGQVRIGQIINHSGLKSATVGQGSSAAPFCIAPELVGPLQELRKQRLNTFLRKETRSLCELCVSRKYLDPVSARPNTPRRAAFEPVFVTGPRRSLTNLGWLVIVHDFYPADAQ